MQIVMFTIKDNYYAIESKNVEEITQQLIWTPVPNAPEWVQGLINLRGEVLTLINFQQLLYPDGGGKDLCYNRSIILSTNNGKIALMVDDVEEVTQVEPTAIELADKNGQEKVAGVISIKDKIVSMLNLDALLPKSEGE